jgi:hypothetical protein
MPSRPRAARFSPEDINRLLVVGTSCLCLVLLIGGTVWGVLARRLSPNSLGTISGAGVGGGLVAFLWILYKIVRVTLLPGTNQ